MTATTREPRTEPLQAPDPPRPGDGEGDRLGDEAAKLRSRASVPVDRWFQLAGAALMGIGVLAIIAGWYGVAHTARQWRQTPYVLSGGVLGLALVFVGAFAYFAFWLTRLVESTQRQTAVLERIEVALTGARRETDDESTVVADGILHRASCPLLAGRAGLAAPTGKEKGLRACPVCEPPV